MSYSEFIAGKLSRFSAVGFDSEPHSDLFDFQRALTKWALRIGRCALFADTGLGKTRMQLDWPAGSRDSGEDGAEVKQEPLPIRLERLARRLTSSSETAPYAHTCYEAADVLRKAETRIEKAIERLKRMQK